MHEVLTLIAWIVVVAGALALLVYLAAKIVERRNPPVGKFLEVDGARLHYVERGSGLPVVFLHGNATMPDRKLVLLADILAEIRASLGRRRNLP